MQLVTLRTGDGVTEGRDGVTGKAHIALGSAADTAQPALQVDFFAGSVDLAVVENVPA